MIWLWENGNELFFLFVFPLVGLWLEFLITNRKRKLVLVVSSILVLPIFTDYNYVIPGFFQILGITLLGSLYSLSSEQIENRTIKIRNSIIISGLLFIILGFFALMDNFLGNQTVLTKWHTEGYKVEYVKDQGFAGRPLMKYELYEYSPIPIFIKKLETVHNYDTTNNCNVLFIKTQITFDKCKGTIKHELK